MRAVIKAFYLVKEEERRAFLEYFYFKLKEEYSEYILEFNNDEEIEVGRVNIINTTSNRGLEFAEYLYEI